MLHVQLVALTLVAIALATSGCGGSTKTTTVIVTPARKPLTRTEVALLARAGSICKRIDARHSSLKLNTRQAIVRELPIFASYQRAALIELIKLTPPAALVHDWREFTAAAHTLVSDTTTFGDDVTAKQFKAAGKIVTTVNKDELYMRDLAKLDTISGCEHVY